MAKRNRRRRKGRELELLVRQIEQSLVGTTAVVKSPDFIRDVHTGRRREVDISIRQMIGSSELLVILECRDRRKRQDATWIEQLATKKASVKADKVVAVSRVPFSSEAVQKAHALGIEIRTISDLSVETVRSWCAMEFVEDRFPHLEVARIDVGLKEGSAAPGMQFTPHDRVFEIVGQSERLTGMDLVNQMLAQNPHWADDLPPDGAKVEKRLDVAIGGNRLLLHATAPPLEVERLLVTGNGTQHIKRRPMKNALGYATDQKSVAQVIDFPIGPQGLDLGLRLIRNDSTGQVGVWLIKGSQNLPNG